MCLSPGLTAGGGLKRIARGLGSRARCLSPGLTAGGGLKRVAFRQHGDRLRAFPRPHRRGRIETAQAVQITGNSYLSPGLTAGGGLKRLYSLTHCERCGFPPASPPGAD